jgi:hypothetical protein
MKSAILMTSVAVAALASPAFAGPDRFDQGSSCIGMSGAECVQAQMRLEDGNRAAERPGPAVDSGDATASTGAISGTSATASGTSATAFGARSADDEDLGDEVGDEAEEIGDEVSDTADEVGDEVGDTADEAGDDIADAADEAGDAISSPFGD